jgi:hypothetical protein
MYPMESFRNENQLHLARRRGLPVIVTGPCPATGHNAAALARHRIGPPDMPPNAAISPKTLILFSQNRPLGLKCREITLSAPAQKPVCHV